MNLTEEKQKFFKEFTDIVQHQYSEPMLVWDEVRGVKPDEIWQYIESLLEKQKKEIFGELKRVTYVEYDKNIRAIKPPLIRPCKECKKEEAQAGGLCGWCEAKRSL